jgi:lipoprotein LpqH
VKINRSFRQVRKQFSSGAAAAMIAASVGACTSSPSASPAGTLPPGTAKVTVNDRGLSETTAVQCTQIGSLTTISIGHAAAGVTALVSNQNALTGKSVSINDLGGFTGSYMEGLGGKTQVTMTGETYTIRGSAEGFDTANPSRRATGTFIIQVAC